MAVQIFALRGRFLDRATDCGIASGGEQIEDACKRAAFAQAEISRNRVVIEAVDYDPRTGKIYSANVRYKVAWDEAMQRFAIPPTFRRGPLPSML